MDRREFLKLLGSSLALSGLGACTRQPREPILPYVNQQPEITPGMPIFFATAMPLGGWAKGILVKTYQGRPVKIEGNPSHPASLGATDAFMQAAILDLYDPTRSRNVLQAAQPRSWGAFLADIQPRMADPRFGAGLRILTERISSPTLLDQIRTLLQRFPGARWHEYDPLDAGTLTGEAIPMAIVDWERTDVVVALDADLFGNGPANLQQARAFAGTRRPHEQGGRISRLYVAESSLTLTGAMADSRLPIRSSEIERLATEIRAGLGGGNPGSEWLQAVIRDLQEHRGRAVVVAGEWQPAAVHTLVAEINTQLGGKAVPAIVSSERGPPLVELVEAMRAGQVTTLLMLGGNVVYGAPADLEIESALAKVPLRIHLGLEFDETSAQSHWHIPEAHFLETWSDARAFDGTETILQPVIEPLFGGRSAHELLSAFLGEPQPGYAIVRAYWQKQNRWPDFEAGWRRSLSEGLVRPGPPPHPSHPSPTSPRSHQPGLEINFRPDPSAYDGRFAGNHWLQELPKPFTKLTWDNAALLGPATAARLGVASEQMVELTLDGRSVRAPALIQPGHADDSVTVTLGYGRSHGRETGRGFNAGAIRSSRAFWFGTGLELKPLGKPWPLATTQEHQRMEGRDLVRWISADQHPPETHEPHASFLAPEALLESENQWGMAIDLSTCIGCNACVIACQAENNIPTVGKKEVAWGREMHWLRIDTYFEGPPAAPRVHFQPVLCMHCETAPCELVCPVAATVHDAAGLNLQVYNRCVGTRYCSNNCPYKVRRFNFLEYNADISPSEQLQKNPNVTVRSRGVMEKCTYCLQRIAATRIEARKENRPIRDGEVTTACAQVCPADAIIFGDLRDRASRVVRLKASPRNYALLAELNTRPRTTHLAKVRNEP